MLHDSFFVISFFLFFFIFSTLDCFCSSTLYFGFFFFFLFLFVPLCSHFFLLPHSSRNIFFATATVLAVFFFFCSLCLIKQKINCIFIAEHEQKKWRFLLKKCSLAWIDQNHLLIFISFRILAKKKSENVTRKQKLFRFLQINCRFILIYFTKVGLCLLLN